MTLSVNVFLSLDGVMQGPGAADEDESGGFDRGGWLAPHMSTEVSKIVGLWFSRADGFLLGRNTYDLMQPYWEPVTDPADTVAYILNSVPKYLVSSNPDSATWHNTYPVIGDPREAAAELKHGHGEVQLHGSHQLVQSLHGLVDEYRLLVFPVVVGGGGKRLFSPEVEPSGFRVMESETLNNGVQHVRLRPIPYGTADFGPRETL